MGRLNISGFVKLVVVTFLAVMVSLISMGTDPAFCSEKETTTLEPGKGFTGLLHSGQLLLYVYILPICRGKMMKGFIRMGTIAMRMNDHF